MRKNRSKSTKMAQQVSALQDGKNLRHPIYQLIYLYAQQHAIYLFEIPPEKSEQAVLVGFEGKDKEYLDADLLTMAESACKDINTPVLMPATLFNILLAHYNKHFDGESSELSPWFSQFLTLSKDDNLIIKDDVDWNFIFLKILDNLLDAKLIDASTYRLLSDNDAAGKAKQDEIRRVFGTLNPDDFRLFLPIFPVWSDQKQTLISQSLLYGFDGQDRINAAIEILKHPDLELKGLELLTFLSQILDSEEGLRHSNWDNEPWLSLLPALDTPTAQRILKMPLTENNLNTLHFLLNQFSPLLAQTLDVMQKPENQFLLVLQLKTKNSQGLNPLNFAIATGQDLAAQRINDAISQLEPKYRQQLAEVAPYNQENPHLLFNKRKERDSSSPIVPRHKKPST